MSDAMIATMPVLDPPTQAVLVMSLLAFTLLGLALMVGAALAGRWVRRISGDELREPLPLGPRSRGEAVALSAAQSTATPFLARETAIDHRKPASSATTVR
ncbi:hypothetical protein [Botrimarina sp.]|uniref:hypothetical protein n=1 Tax=Botrimarina sp. TaxID=2795802 RepID=UPI0032EFDE79